MRRSRTIRLTLLAGSALLLHACGGEDVDSVDVVIPNLAACVARFGAGAQADCERTMASAQQEHTRSAPRFADLAACREATGSDCEEAPANRASDKALAPPTTGSIAIPVLAGVLVGRMMGSGAGRVTTPLYAGRAPRECPPGQSAALSDCAPAGSRSSGSTGGRYFFSGGSFAGSTAAGQRGAAAFAPSPAMATTLASSRIGGPATVARGGFGASARGFGSSS